LPIWAVKITGTAPAGAPVEVRSWTEIGCASNVFSVAVELLTDVRVMTPGGWVVNEETVPVLSGLPKLSVMPVESVTT